MEIGALSFLKSFSGGPVLYCAYPPREKATTTTSSSSSFARKGQASSTLFDTMEFPFFSPPPTEPSRLFPLEERSVHSYDRHRKRGRGRERGGKATAAALSAKLRDSRSFLFPFPPPPFPLGPHGWKDPAEICSREEKEEEGKEGKKSLYKKKRKSTTIAFPRPRTEKVKLQKCQVGLDGRWMTRRIPFPDLCRYYSCISFGALDPTCCEILSPLDLLPRLPNSGRKVVVVAPLPSSSSASSPADFKQQTSFSS